MTPARDPRMCETMTTEVPRIEECPFCGRFGENAEVQGCHVCDLRHRVYANQMRYGHRPIESVLDLLDSAGKLDRESGTQGGVFLTSYFQVA